MPTECAWKRVENCDSDVGMFTKFSPERWRRECVDEWIEGTVDWQHEHGQPRVELIYIQYTISLVSILQ